MMFGYLSGRPLGAFSYSGERAYQFNIRNLKKEEDRDEQYSNSWRIRR
jgi:hypothetical protein